MIEDEVARLDSAIDELRTLLVELRTLLVSEVALTVLEAQIFRLVSIRNSLSTRRVYA